MTSHRPIYKRDKSGKVRQWWIERKGHLYRSCMQTFKDGEEPSGDPQRGAWTAAHPKNIGKANVTSPEQQAEKEVQALYAKKLDREYHLKIEDIDAARYIKPMLAESWDPNTPFVAGLVQPKLDGIRCIATKDGLTSREGQPLDVPHVHEALQPFFKAHPDLALDGELYNHHLRDNFQRIVSAVKKGDPEAAEVLQFHFYDCVMGDVGADKRQSDVEEYIPETLTPHLEEDFRHDYVVIVPTYWADTLADFDELHEKFKAQGYEGSMWRDPNAPYIHGRTKALLKRKDFLDAEFDVVEILKGKGAWADAAKAALLWLPDADRSVGPNANNTFKAGIKHSLEEGRAMLHINPNPAQATVQFQEWTTSKIPKPRFPTVQQFWKEKRNV